MTKGRQPPPFNRCPFLVIPSEAEGPAVRPSCTPLSRQQPLSLLAFTTSHGPASHRGDENALVQQPVPACRGPLSVGRLPSPLSSRPERSVGRDLWCALR